MVAVEFDIFIDGPGPAPAVYQTVSVSGDPVTAKVIIAEAKDHNGKDEFSGAIPDNPQGNANVVSPGLEQVKGPGPFKHNTATHWFFEDSPSFPSPPYAWNFEGTKTFVTTVKDPAGNVLKVIKWHVSQKKAEQHGMHDAGLSISIDS